MDAALVWFDWELCRGVSRSSWKEGIGIRRVGETHRPKALEEVGFTHPRPPRPPFGSGFSRRITAFHEGSIPYASQEGKDLIQEVRIVHLRVGDREIKAVAGTHDPDDAMGDA